MTTNEPELIFVQIAAEDISKEFLGAVVNESDDEPDYLVSYQVERGKISLTTTSKTRYVLLPSAVITLGIDSDLVESDEGE